MQRVRNLPQRKLGRHKRGGIHGWSGASSSLWASLPSWLARAVVLKPFPFQQRKQKQHGEGHILMAWSSSLNAPYLKAAWESHLTFSCLYIGVMEGFSSCCNRLAAAGLVKRSQNPLSGVSCKCFTAVILGYLSWAFVGKSNASKLCS